MKSWIILIAMAIGLTAGATIAVPLLMPDGSTTRPGVPAPTATPDGPAPEVAVDGDLLHKFGFMAQGTEGKHGWVFRNAGPGVLELRNLATDCSCTVAQIGSSSKPEGSKQTILPIKPGQSEPVELTWQTKTFDGAYRKSATIGTNDPHHPKIILTIQGEVFPAVTFIPAVTAIQFDNASNAEETVRSIGITSRDRPGTKITELISSNPELIRVESRPLAPEILKAEKLEAAQELVFTLKPGPKLGAFAEEVLIGTDHPLKPRLTLKVLGRVTGPILLTPTKVLLRGLTTSTGGSQEITITARSKAPVHFQVAGKPEGVDVAVEPAGGSRYKMTVNVLPGVAPGPITDDIVLKTDLVGATEVRIPVDILVQASN